MSNSEINEDYFKDNKLFFFNKKLQDRGNGSVYITPPKVLLKKNNLLNRKIKRIIIEFE